MVGCARVESCVAQCRGMAAGVWSPLLVPTPAVAPLSSLPAAADERVLSCGGRLREDNRPSVADTWAHNKGGYHTRTGLHYQ